MRQPKILLVDDREDGLVALEAVLGPLNYELVKASSGREALCHVLETDFAVIVLDVQMPEMDGFETAELIKRRERSRQIPILFVTAISKDPRFVYRGYEVGAVDYLFKPFDPHVLRSKVQVFVDLYLKNQQLAEQGELLRAAEQKNRLLLETVRDAIVALSADGTILSVNRAFTQMTGWEEGQWVARPFGDLIQNGSAGKSWAGFQGACLHDGDLCEFVLLKSDGQGLDVEISARPIVAASAFSGVVASIRDITPRKEAERIEQRARELERSNRELEQFASVCSHDLQEPLRVISNFAPLLSRRYSDKLDTDGNNILAYIESSTKRMSELVRDLLRYSRLGSQELQREPVSLANPLQEAIKNLQITISDAQAQVEYSDLPEVSANHPQLVQLFQNLIANAIKFRGESAPVIRVAAELRNDECLVTVRDNGIGIDPRFSSRVFEIFRRLHPQDKYPGTGVGLAICKKVVDRHGGRIWLESQPGAGTTFFFTLPVAQPETMALEPAAAAQAP